MAKAISETINGETVASKGASYEDGHQRRMAGRTASFMVAISIVIIVVI